MNVPEVFKTARGTRYLKDPGVVHMTETRFTDRAFFREFLEGFGQGFELYADDLDDAIESGAASDGELAMQVAGQICYLSFGEKRTPFEENADYVVKIMDAAHGSVMHHSGFGFIIYGADRAFTHELVRHGAGIGVSQVSQRYVGPETLRFVMPFEDQQDPELCEKFEAHIDAARVAYSDRIEDLRRVMPRTATETNTEWRKRIQSSARSVLPNDAEAPLFWSANFRALTHVFSMRCSKHADVRIRRPMLEVLSVAQNVAPNVFGHFQRFRLPDGTWEAVSKYLKP
jgi:thymidylate synthase (FAD)